MIKKTIIGVVALAALSTLVFGRDVFSYLRTAGSQAREALKAEVPIEFQIQRAREMVENLVPDIRKCMHVIAEEEVSVEHLNRDIATADADLGKQKGEILALRSDLGNGGNRTELAGHEVGNGRKFRYCGKTYTAAQVEQDLASRFERYKTAEATLASKKQILSAREKSVVAAREKLEKMLASKRTLEVEIENLDAKLKMIQAAQTASNVQLDDSQLARAKKLIGDLNKQLDVAQRVLDAEGKFTGLIPVETADTVPADLTNQIDEYFGPGSNPAEASGNSVAERGSL